jgi:hypothetical protein
MAPNETFPSKTPLSTAELSSLPAILAPKGKWRFAQFDSSTLPNWHEIADGTKSLYFGCLIQYRDVLRQNEILETEIAMIFDSVGNFSPIDSAKYNRAT